MTSFVREILSASGKLGDKEDLHGKTERIRKRLQDLKTGTCPISHFQSPILISFFFKFIFPGMRVEVESQYADYVSSFSEMSKLSHDLESAVAEVEALNVSFKTHLAPAVADQGRETRELVAKLHELTASVQVRVHFPGLGAIINYWVY